MNDKIEKIRQRSLSQRDRQAIAALAAKSGDTGKGEEDESQMPPPPQAEKRNPPNSIEKLAKFYFVTFKDGHDNPTACALTQAAMSLEGAALVAKTIRECLGGQQEIKK